MMPLQKYFTLRNVIILGLVVAFGVTFSEVLRGAHRNFMIFSFSTRDFWSGISPYGQQWWRHGLDYYLYAPTFNVLFAPFAFLPQWLGAFVWNLFNYSLFALSVYYLPRLSELNKCRLLLYSLPILATAQLSFQYNVAIAYIFLFAFTLLEKGYYKWAILLIMTSALTKVYGGFELALLLFYPRLWRNLGWAVLWGAVLFLLPLLRLGGSEFLPYYSQWIGALSSHEDTRVFESFFDTHFLFSQGHPSYTPYVQIGLFMVLAILSLLRHKLWNVYLFRVGVLASIMGWMIVFGSASEKHTYLIAIVGYLFWYWSLPRRELWDKILYWATLLVVVIMPVDLLCPVVVMRFFHDTLELNQLLFLVVWLTIVYRTFFNKNLE